MTMNRLFSVLSGAAALLAVTVMIAGCANHSDAAPSSGAEQPALLTNETTVVFDVVPDYIFVPKAYSYRNYMKPLLMVETKLPNIVMPLAMNWKFR